MCIFPNSTTWSEKIYCFSTQVHFSALFVAMKYHSHDFRLYCLSVRAQDLMWEIELDGRDFPHPPYIQFQNLLHPRHVSHPIAFGYLKWIVSPINTYVSGFESHKISYKTWKTLSAKSGTYIYVPIKSQVVTTPFFQQKSFLGKI